MNLPRVEPVVVPARYRVTLALVAVVMVLLPLIYVALIALAAMGVVLYVTDVWPMISRAEIRGIGALVVYGGPPIAGTVLVWFMLRSMWPAKRQERAGRQISEADEPALYEWVRAIAGAVGTPEPTEIRIDLEINASAALRRGVWSVGSRDLTLTLGLPLAAGLDTRQLAGIVAHELGHFAQRGGLGVTTVIRTINRWFARVVYERGSFDDSLRQNSVSEYWWASVIMALSRFFVWVSRLILSGLMHVAGALSGALSRQMEYDADRYETRLVGAACAAGTTAELRHLTRAGHAAWSEVAQRWQARELPDDVPALVVDHRQRLTAEDLEAPPAEKASWYDTHPSDSDRVASIEREGGDGVYREERPASTLFRDFPALSRELSTTSYREQLGDDFASARIVGLEALEATRRAHAEQEAALARVFGTLDGPSRAAHLPPFAARPAEEVEARGADAEGKSGEAIQTGETGESGELAALQERWTEQWTKLAQAEGVRVLEAAGAPIEASFREQAIGKAADAGDAGGMAIALRREIEGAEKELHARDGSAGRRVARAIAAATPEEFAEAERWRTALATLDKTIPTVRLAADYLHALTILLPHLEELGKDSVFVGVLNDRATLLAGQLGILRGDLAGRENPLSDHAALASLDVALFGPTQKAIDIGSTHQALGHWRTLRRGLLGRLAVLTERIEGRVAGVT